MILIRLRGEWSPSPCGWGHMHGLLLRAIMDAGAAGAPKKGKAPKPTAEATYRCRSLRHCLSRAREFGVDLGAGDAVVARALWDACCHLCEVVAVVIRGCNGGGDGESTSDTLAEREKAATAFINLTTQLVRSAQETFRQQAKEGRLWWRGEGRRFEGSCVREERRRGSAGRLRGRDVRVVFFGGAAGRDCRRWRRRGPTMRLLSQGQHQ